MPGDAGQTRLDQPEKVIVSFHMDLPAGRGRGSMAWGGEFFLGAVSLRDEGVKTKAGPPAGAVA